MQSKLHRILAINLALLILVSTTGFSMTLGWCYCSNQEHFSMFIPTECCSHDEASTSSYEKISSCCAKDALKTNHSCSEIEGSNHCDFEIDFVQSDIDFNTLPSLDLPLFDKLWINVWQPLPTLPSFETAAPFFVATISKINGNKAPPLLLFGKKLLQFIQIYRC